MEVFNLNFFSQFKLYSKICSKLNKLKKRVLIINVSSKVILNGGYNIYEYSTSKAATANLIKCLHREFNNLKFINLVLPTVGNIKNKQTITYKIFINYLSNIIKNYKKMKNYKTKIIK
jgi:NAD(P)-dependent dehydrogenase (short-subunit alcohol dehydrogenase family)